MSGSNAWLGGENQNVGGGQREVRWLTPPHIPAALGKFDLDPCGAPGHERTRSSTAPPSPAPIRSRRAAQIRAVTVAPDAVQ